MTEQQIDAELCQYEPYHNAFGEWVWIATEGALNCYLLQCVKREHFNRLVSPTERGTEGDCDYCTYPTREAAFADLRQAIAITPASE